VLVEEADVLHLVHHDHRQRSFAGLREDGLQQRDLVLEDLKSFLAD
jgi:hypothetical protein